MKFNIGLQKMFFSPKSTILLLFSIFLSTIILFGCKSKKEKEEGITKIKNGFVEYHLPEEKKLPKAEAEKLKNEAETWYNTTIAPTGFQGQVLVAKNGQIVFESYSNSPEMPTIDKNTSLHIASVSKTFTASAILYLQQIGKLNIDDLFSKYFPNFNYPDITIKDLLSHRSGLPNYEYFLSNLGWDQNIQATNQDVLNFLIAHKFEIKDVRKPNSNFAYSNTNYALLALVIEKVTGKPFPEFMKQTIFAPAGMEHTFIYEPKDSNVVSKNYNWRGQEEKMNFLDRVYGDKNVYSTVEDLLKWDRLLTSDLFLNDSSKNMAYTPYSNERPGIKNYGLGWRMNIFPNGKKMIFHNGWWHGNTSSFIRLIDENATIIALSNRFNRATYKTKLLVNNFAQYFDMQSLDPEDQAEMQTVSSKNSIDSTKTKSATKKKNQR